MSDDETHGEQGNGSHPHAKAKHGNGLRVIELPLKREVSEKHLANLRASGLTDETIGLGKLYTESNPHAIATLVQRKTWPSMSGAALVFPFFVPEQSEPVGYRIRPTNPRVIKTVAGKRKYAKYDQSAEAKILVYFTPRALNGNWYADGTRILHWCEGEKKGLLLDQLGLCVVALTGVFNGIDIDHKESTGVEILHPQIRKHVVIAGRHHIVCFDADAKENHQVMLAAGRLCGMLKAAGAASVRFITPPSLDHKGIDDYFVGFGDTATLQLLESAAPIEPINPKEPLARILSIRALASAPIDKEMRMPEGYKVERDGTLWKIGGDDKHGDTRIGRGPILIQRYLDDYYSGESRVEICFPRGKRWVNVCVLHKAIADSRTMISELTTNSAPVTSNTASQIVDWIDELERINEERIPRVNSVGRGGWHVIEGQKTFVLNEPVVSADVENSADRVALALDTRGDRRKLFAALKSRGKADAHLTALRRAWSSDPIAAAMICGALAAPLLEPLGAPNFAVHLPGDSSRGKTTMLKIAASVYGDPTNDHWVASWNTTTVAAELRAATYTDLPLCFDEVGASDPQQVERLVYMLVNGGGRVRGSKDLQLRETPSWRTVLLSTGERDLADDSTATGAQIRVVHLPVTGFGKLRAREIDELRDACIANAGCFGRTWIEALLDVDDWEPFRLQYRETTRTLREQAKDSLEQRVAAYFAVLCVAEHLASQAGLGERGGQTMRRLFGDKRKRADIASSADRARDLVRDWVLSEPEAFPELRSGSAGQLEQAAARSQARVLHGFRLTDSVLLIGKELRTFLESQNHAPRQILREWAHRGWLDHDVGRYDKCVRIGSSTPRFVCLELTLDDKTNLATPPPEKAGN